MSVISSKYSFGRQVGADLHGVLEVRDEHRHGLQGRQLVNQEVGDDLLAAREEVHDRRQVDDARNPDDQDAFPEDCGHPMIALHRGLAEPQSLLAAIDRRQLVRLPRPEALQPVQALPSEGHQDRVAAGEGKVPLDQRQVAFHERFEVGDHLTDGRREQELEKVPVFDVLNLPDGAPEDQLLGAVVDPFDVPVAVHHVRGITDLGHRIRQLGGGGGPHRRGDFGRRRRGAGP